jgi:hypothetical protein
MQAHDFLPAELLRVTTGALEEAWSEAVLILGGPPVDPISMRAQLARRIMAAAGNGERDPERLKKIALGAISA